jgi:cell division protein FtsL
MTATTVSPLRRERFRPVAPRSRPELRVVRESRPRHTLTYALAVIVLVGAAVFGAVSMNALAAAASVEARTLEAQVSTAERAYSQLVAEVASLEDPGRIRTAALDLGLVPAGPARVLVLDRNLPADGAVAQALHGDVGSDPVKPLLSAER